MIEIDKVRSIPLDELKIYIDLEERIWELMKEVYQLRREIELKQAANAQLREDIAKHSQS